jgi:hypothetical protein
MENGSLSASDVALLGRDGSWEGNSFMWIFALLILAGGGFNGFGNGYRPQYATQDFVQNGFNFNDLQSQNRDIMNQINQAKYDNINVMKDVQAILGAQLNSIQMTAQQNQANQNECCCNILRAIDGVNYNQAMQTQKVLDAISGNRMADMQNQINQLQLQNAVAGVVRYPSASTYYAGNNPFCSNCGCSNI